MIPYHSTPVLYQLPQCSFPLSKGNFKGSNSNPIVKTKSNSFSTSRDSEWLTLEICREFLRGTCPREDLTCRYAHPPKNIYCNNSRVVCCYDYIKGRCQRFQPPCKYLHPPNHLKEQLLQNGKANLLLKNMKILVPSIQKSAPISRTHSTGSYHLGPIPVASRGYSQSQTVEATAMNNLQSLSYISPGPYFVLSTHDNQSIHNAYRTNIAIEQITQNPNLQQKSLTSFNYTMATTQNIHENMLTNQVPMQPYFYSNPYSTGNQLFVKNWPLCTYSTVPY